MAYSTITEVERACGGADKLLQLTDLAASGSPDTAIVDLAIAEADGVIDAYVGKRWAAGGAPDVLRLLSAKMAARFIRRDRAVPRPTDVEDEVADTKFLRDVAMGVATLPAGSTEADIVSDVADTRQSTRAVSREKLKGYC